jgi:hypothetical protein
MRACQGAEYVLETVADLTAMGIALAGTVMAWSTLHGTVGLEVALRFAGMGHRGDTLLSAHIESLAEGFHL